MKHYYVYILSSPTGTLYIGVTNNLLRRINEHRLELIDGFSKKYQCKKLIYFEGFSYINDAIMREKQLKKWRRNKKIWLIKKINPTFKDITPKNPL